MPLTVAILGASAKSQRYAHQAQLRLQEAGHRVLPVTPQVAAIHGLPCYASLRAVADTGIAVDCVTLYVGTHLLRPQIPDLIELAPSCVIANPGADDPQLLGELRAAGLRVEPACTLVLLRLHRFSQVVAGVPKPDGGG